MKVVNALISSAPNARFNLMIEAILPNGKRRTVGKSFVITQGITLQELETFLTLFIETFEAQSGSGELEGFSESSLVRVHNITSAPNPEAHPFTSDPANIQWVKETKATQKAAKKRSASTIAIKDLESNLSSGFQELSQAMVESHSQIAQSFTQIIQAMQQSNVQILETIKSQQQPPTLNWTPLIQAVASAIPAVVGVPVQTPTPTPTPAPQTQTTPAAPASKDLLTPAQVTPIAKGQPPAETAMITNRMDKLESLITQQSKVLEIMSSTVSQLSQGFNTLSDTVSKQGSTISHLSQGFNTLSQIVAASSGVPSKDSNSSNGSSTPPAPPQEPDPSPSPSSNNIPKSSPPISLPEIGILRPVSDNQSFNSKIVTADLEAVIDPNGQNIVYMAAWYNGTDHNIFDISQWGIFP